MIPMAALVLDWALTALWPLIGASGLRYYDSLIFMVAGLAIGLALMAPFLAVGGRWRRVFSREAAPSLIKMSVFSGMASLIYIAALAYTTPVNAVILAQVEVLYSTLLSARFLGERPSLKQTLASLLVVAGTGLIVLRDLRTPRWRGDLMILATPWMYQVSHIFSKKLPKHLDALTLSAGRVFYGLVGLAPLTALLLARGARWSWEPEALKILLLQGSLMSFLNFYFWYVAIRGMDLSKATTMLLSYPALTLLFSWGLGREDIHLVQVAGLAVTLSGALWTARLALARHRELVVSSQA